MDKTIQEKYIAEFEELLQSTEREGVENLIQWIREETDFYSAPASTKGHGSFEGGLLVHSLSVYRLLGNFSKNIKEVNPASVVIVGLLHDLCKVNFYIKTVRNVKIPGERRWEEVQGYGIEDSMPLGHGEKICLYGHETY